MNVRFITNEIITAAKILKDDPAARVSFKRNVKELYATPEGRAAVFSRLQERIDPLTLEQYAIMASAYPAVILTDRMFREEGFYKSVMPHTIVPATLRTMARHPGWSGAYLATFAVAGYLKANRMKKAAETPQSVEDMFAALTSEQDEAMSKRRIKMIREIIAILREGTEQIRKANREMDTDSVDTSEIRRFIAVEEATDRYLVRLKNAVMTNNILAVDDVLSEMAGDDEASIVAIAVRLDKVWMCAD